MASRMTSALLFPTTASNSSFDAFFSFLIDLNVLMIFFSVLLYYLAQMPDDQSLGSDLTNYVLPLEEILEASIEFFALQFYSINCKTGQRKVYPD